MKEKRFISEAVIRRAESTSERTREWLENLEHTIEILEAQWQIHIGDAFTGGTHAFVAPAEREDGTKAIIKIDMPEETADDAFANELRFLRLANGNGYVSMYAEDIEKRACLLEYLGEPLAKLGYPVNRQIEILCEALEKIWSTPVKAPDLPDGNASIKWFREFISSTYESNHHPCSEEIIEQAMRFLQSREENMRSKENVLLHGDATAQNILRVPNTENEYKLIDADGIFYEKAYDLGVIMREWQSEYEKEPIKKGLERCEYLHTLTGVDKQAIWEWGYLQSVSTALVTIDILPEESKKMFRTAGEWLKHPQA